MGELILGCIKFGYISSGEDYSVIKYNLEKQKYELIFNKFDDLCSDVEVPKMIQNSTIAYMSHMGSIARLDTKSNKYDNVVKMKNKAFVNSFSIGDFDSVIASSYDSFVELYNVRKANECFFKFSIIDYTPIIRISWSNDSKNIAMVLYNDMLVNIDYPSISKSDKVEIERYLEFN